MFSITKKAALDLAERVVRTFVAVFAGLYVPAILGADSLDKLVDLSLADKAATAGVVAVLTLLLGVIGVNVKDGDDASLLKKK